MSLEPIAIGAVVEKCLASWELHNCDVLLYRKCRVYLFPLIDGDRSCCGIVESSATNLGTPRDLNLYLDGSPEAGLEPVPLPVSVAPIPGRDRTHAGAAPILASRAGGRA